jgi:hypothetical protein
MHRHKVEQATCESRNTRSIAETTRRGVSGTGGAMDLTPGIRSAAPQAQSAWTRDAEAMSQDLDPATFLTWLQKK